MKYAIFGATGAVGKALAPLLAARQEPFRVVGRSLDRLRRDFGRYQPLAELHAADLSHPAAAASAAADAETLFYLAGVPYTQFELHPKLSATSLEAAATAGVRRFLHVGTVYPYGKPRQERVNESHPRDPHTFKGRMRKEQEDLVFAADGRNGMRTTVLRPPDYYGPHAELSFARAIFDAALGGGTANVIGPVDTPHEFIFVPDVAAALLALAGKREAFGQAWNLAGPEPVSTRQFAELVFGAAGTRVRLRAANGFLLRAMGLFNPLFREIAAMHYLWTTPVLLDDSRLRQLLPHLPRTSHEEGIRLTLQSMREEAGAGERPGRLVHPKRI